jgi:hypothetical protein
VKETLIAALATYEGKVNKAKSDAACNLEEYGDYGYTRTPTQIIAECDGLLSDVAEIRAWINRGPRTSERPGIGQMSYPEQVDRMALEIWQALSTGGAPKVRETIFSWLAIFMESAFTKGWNESRKDIDDVHD